MAVSRLLIYTCLAAAGIAAYVWSSGDPPKTNKPQSLSPVASKKSEDNWDFPATLTSTHFDPPTDPARDIFKPLLALDKATLLTEHEDLMKVPPNLAGGEADWAYTGMVEINGVRMALLENGSSHQGGYVKEGDMWKKSRIIKITSPSIDVVGPDGTEETVFRYNANATPKAKPPPDTGFKPLNPGPALKGLIGSKLDITPTAEAPAGAPPSIKK